MHVYTAVIGKRLCVCATTVTAATRLDALLRKRLTHIVRVFPDTGSYNTLLSYAKKGKIFVI